MDVFFFVGPYVYYSMFSHPEATPEDFHWLFIGAAGAITPLHIDPSLTHAWLTQISGRKRFTLFAPWDIPELLSNETDRFLVKIGNSRQGWLPQVSKVSSWNIVRFGTFEQKHCLSSFDDNQPCFLGCPFQDPRSTHRNLM